jgi:hypothetical protein
MDLICKRCEVVINYLYLNGQLCTWCNRDYMVYRRDLEYFNEKLKGVFNEKCLNMNRPQFDRKNWKVDSFTKK